jgi:hypothetical protein
MGDGLICAVFLSSQRVNTRSRLFLVTLPWQPSEPQP